MTKKVSQGILSTIILHTAPAAWFQIVISYEKKLGIAIVFAEVHFKTMNSKGKS